MVSLLGAGWEWCGNVATLCFVGLRFLKVSQALTRVPVNPEFHDQTLDDPAEPEAAPQAESGRSAVMEDPGGDHKVGNHARLVEGDVQVRKDLAHDADRLLEHRCRDRFT